MAQRGPIELIREPSFPAVNAREALTHAALAGAGVAQI
jgi:hypothetical protein